MEENPYTAPKSTLASPVQEAEKPSLMKTLFSFEGRVPRRVYWGVTLAVSVIMIIPLVALAIYEESTSNDPSEVSPLFMVGMILFLILLIPAIWISIAITVKRWHDRGKSGWMYLVGMIPYIGGIWTFVECGCLRGTEGDNQYGPDPT